MKNLYAALIKFQSQLKPIPRTKEVKYGNTKYKYADLAETWDAVRKNLSENGLAIIQYFDSSSEGEQYLSTRLVHESGEAIDSRIKIILVKSDAQSLGSATTYYRRYAFSAILGLTTEEDDDGKASAAEETATANKPYVAPNSTAPVPPPVPPFSPPLGQAIGGLTSPNAPWPNCPECGQKMLKSKFDSGPAFYCINKKNHKPKDEPQLF